MKIGASSKTRWSHRLCTTRAKATAVISRLRCELETRLTALWVGPVPLLAVRVAAVGQRGVRRRAARRSRWRTRFLQGENTSSVHQRQTQQDAHILIPRPGLSDLVRQKAVFLKTRQSSEAAAATTTHKAQFSYISDKTVDLKQP